MLRAGAALARARRRSPATARRRPDSLRVPRMRRELVCTGAGHAAAPGRAQRRHARTAARAGAGARAGHRPSTRSTSSAPPATAGACSASRARRAFRSCSATTLPAASKPSAPACRALRRGNACSVCSATGRAAARMRRMSSCRRSCLLPAPERRRRSRRSPCCPTRSRRCGSRCARPGSPQPTRPAVRVLINGAAVALGRLAMQVLSPLGQRRSPRSAGEASARTASSSAPRSRSSAARGHRVAARGLRRGAELRELGRRCALASRLGARARWATRRPCIRCSANFDRLGWLRGACASRRDAQAVRSAVRARAPQARYAWTIFKPDREALEALADGVARAKASRCRSASRALRQRRSPRSTMCRRASPAERCCCRDVTPDPNEDEAHERNCLPWQTCSPSNARHRRPARQHLRDDRRRGARRTPTRRRCRSSCASRTTRGRKSGTTRRCSPASRRQPTSSTAWASARTMSSPSCCPICPQTHLTIWGGQAAGIAFAINPLLEPAAIVRAARRPAKRRCWSRWRPFPAWTCGRSCSPCSAVSAASSTSCWSTWPQHLPGARRLAAAAREHRGRRRRFACTTSPKGSQPAGRPPDQRARDPPGRPVVLLLHRRHHRHAQDRDAHAMRTRWPTRGASASSSATASRRGKTLFCGLPLFHVNGVLVTGLLPFSRGAHVILGTPQGYRGEGVIPHFWEMVEHHRINFFSGVPTVYAALLQQPTQGRDLSSLEYGLCGAAPMPRGTDARLPGADRAEDPRGLRPDRGHLRQHLSIRRWASGASARSVCACPCRR